MKSILNVLYVLLLIVNIYISVTKGKEKKKKINRKGKEESTRQL